MFSTITIASSTRMPIEKIKANSETRLIVKPIASEAKSVSISVMTTALPTTIASRHPNVTSTRTTTQAVANTSLKIRWFALSVAVLP